MNKLGSWNLLLLLSLFRQYASYIILLISVAILIIVIMFELWPFLGAAIGIFIGGGLAVILNTDFDIGETFTSVLDWRIGWSLVALYVVATIFIYRDISKSRPDIQYLLFGLIAAALAYQIYLGTQRRHIIPQILIFSFITYWSSQFAFPLGINGPDTFEFIQATKRILVSAHVPNNVVYATTPGHMIYIGEVSLVTGLSVQLSYYLGSVLTLLAAASLIAGLSNVIPRIDTRTATLGALVFATASFTIQRGMYPTKLNFFKPLILVSIYAAYVAMQSKSMSRRFVPVLVTVVAALVYGHTYSTGITMIVVASLFGFWALVELSDGLDYSGSVPQGSLVPIALVFPVVILGYSMIGGNGLLARVADIAVSILDILGVTAVDEVSGSAGGRYTSLSVGVLVFSSLSQLILFGLSVLGGVVLLNKREWGYDSILIWVITGFGLIGFSLLINASDIPTPRIHTMLVMFGLNFVTVIGIYTLSRMTTQQRRATLAAVVVGVFAATSLASPVAGITMSPVGDKIPHFRSYNTAQEFESNEWNQQYLNSPYYNSERSRTELPIEQVGPFTANVNIKTIANGRAYIYSDTLSNSGVVYNTRSTGLGGRQFVFVKLPKQVDNHSIVYENGQETVYIANKNK